MPKGSYDDTPRKGKEKAPVPPLKIAKDGTYDDKPSEKWVRARKNPPRSGKGL